VQDELLGMLLGMSELVMQICVVFEQPSDDLCLLRHIDVN
jgi:hypothetical protein